MQTLWSLNICHKTRRFIRTSGELVIRTKKTTSLLQSAHQQTPPLLHPSFHPPSAHGRSTFKPLKKNPTTTPSERQHHATCVTLQLLVKQTKVWSENNPSLLKTLSRWIDTAQRGGGSQTPTVPGQLGGGRVHHVLDLNPHFPGLPGVAEVPHLQRDTRR